MMHGNAWICRIVRWCWHGGCLLRNVQVQLCRFPTVVDKYFCIGIEENEFFLGRPYTIVLTSFMSLQTCDECWRSGEL